MGIKPDLIQETREGFEDLAGLVQATADNLIIGSGNIGDIGLIIEKMDELFKSMGQIKDGLENQEEMLKDFIAMSSDTNRVLIYIMDALGSGDVVLLSDLLQYELKVRIERWVNFLSEIGAGLQ